MKPLVSVIIPNYNYAHYIGEAVESVLRQTYQPLEVIVVDDGSRDDSLSVLEQFGNKISLLTQQNSGVSAARNFGASQSSGELIAFLDADDVWLPEKIEKQVRLFNEDPAIGLVHVGVEDIDGGGSVVCRHLSGLHGNVSKDLLLFEKPVILGGGSGAVVRRELFQSVGGFDTRLSTSADWDFHFQVCLNSEVGFIPEVLLRYRVHSSNMHGNIAAMEHDTSLAWAKAFRTDDVEILQLRRRAYGGLHKTLAGSYLHSGNYTAFARNLLKSLWYQPEFLAYYLMLPLRRRKN